MKKKKFRLLTNNFGYNVMFRTNPGTLQLLMDIKKAAKVPLKSCHLRNVPKQFQEIGQFQALLCALQDLPRGNTDESALPKQ